MTTPLPSGQRIGEVLILGQSRMKRECILLNSWSEIQNTILPKKYRTSNNYNTRGQVTIYLEVVKIEEVGNN